MAISPPILCASLAGNSGNWDLFERSGSITTAMGLLVASRRYVQYGVVELAMLQARGPAPDAREMLEDILTAKLGLALSAFGTVIWGWGGYLGWWSFSCLLVWALFAARDARRDFRKASACSESYTVPVPQRLRRLTRIFVGAHTPHDVRSCRD